MKKFNLTLLVVTLITSTSLWLLNSNNAEASREGGEVINVLFEKIEFKPIEQKMSDILIIYQQQKEIESLKSEIVKLEKEIEELKQGSEEESPFQYYIDNGRKGYFELTAYTNGKESTGKTPDHPEYGVTASGTKTKENHTIACPKSWDFGTQVFIPSLDNVYTCEDVGGAIKSGKLDVFIEGLNEALIFGRKKNVEVYIMDEV